MYTKFIIVTDDDVNVRDWKEVIWALTTRVDPRARHADRREHADRLSRFREPGRRAWARRWGSTRPTSGRARPTRAWGTPIAMDETVKQRVDFLWRELGL